MRYIDRINKLVMELSPHDVDAMIIVDPINLRYFTGVPGPGVLVVAQSGFVSLYVPPINYELAEENCPPEIELDKTKLNEGLEVVAAQAVSSYSKIGVDKVDVDFFYKLTKSLPAATVKNLQSLVWRFRTVKDENELAMISEACRLADRVMESASELVSDGISENEIKSEIVREIYLKGCEGPAFEPIVASGPNSALPHGAIGGTRRASRTIRKGDVVVIDLGVRFGGYCSDITRTFVVGRPADPNVMDTIESLMKVKQEAEFFFKPGVSCGYVDMVARRSLSEKGLGAHFIHSLGHGIGLEVHEPPRLMSGNVESLQVNMVVTCEPGAYFKGSWGVRIEDTILVTNEGPKKLTEYPIFEEISV